VHFLIVSTSAPRVALVQQVQASAPVFCLHASTPVSKASVFFVQSKKKIRKMKNPFAAIIFDKNIFELTVHKG